MNAKRVHHFHAEATALHAQLQHPLTQEIKPQNFVKLPKGGGYLSEHAKDFRVEHVVSYKSAHTHVAGHESPKRDHPWITLTTCSIEDLNVLEVVTADRVVSQIATEHPREKGHVPTVTFLGTRFEGLKVAGVPVGVTLKFELEALKPPSSDTPYLEDAKFLEAIGAAAPPASFAGEWAKYLKDVEKNPRPAARVTGSLAFDVSLGGRKLPGNVIDVPEFGKIILAELIVDCDTFHLTMIRLEMGCIAGGSMSAGVGITNGSTRP